nr:MAG TPA: hypothetical protein [Caudoviricetes sp.]
MNKTTGTCLIPKRKAPIPAENRGDCLIPTPKQQPAHGRAKLGNLIF